MDLIDERQDAGMYPGTLACDRDQRHAAILSRVLTRYKGFFDQPINSPGQRRCIPHRNLRKVANAQWFGNIRDCDQQQLPRTCSGGGRASPMIDGQLLPAA